MRKLYHALVKDLSANVYAKVSLAGRRKTVCTLQLGIGAIQRAHGPVRTWSRYSSIVRNPTRTWTRYSNVVTTRLVHGADILAAPTFQVVHEDRIPAFRKTHVGIWGPSTDSKALLQGYLAHVRHIPAGGRTWGPYSNMKFLPRWNIGSMYDLRAE